MYKHLKHTIDKHNHNQTLYTHTHIFLGKCFIIQRNRTWVQCIDSETY